MAEDAPQAAHTVVVGGGTGGATCAGLLAELGQVDVLLLEAGPDYGSYAAGGWPAEMLDARAVPVSHDWHYASVPLLGEQVIDLPRARVIGGCSAHNGCTVSFGAHEDYDSWARAGNPGWASAEIAPLLPMIRERMRVRVYDRTELTPPQEAFLASGLKHGLPFGADLDQLEAGVGIGPMSANVHEGVRWNAAFAFVDPVRGRRNLRIQGDALVDRVEFRAGRVAGVRAIIAGEPCFITCQRVVLAGGAYGSPAMLFRSGIGAASELARLGVQSVVDLPGVGENLLDHPCARLDFRGSAAFQAGLASAVWWPDEQVVARARSSLCDKGPYDIHLFLVAGLNTALKDAPPISLYGGVMRARSQGSVRLRDTHPESTLIIDPAYVTDPEGHDRQVLTEAMALMRAITEEAGFAALLGEAVRPDDPLPGAGTAHYCHPAGTCRMGPEGDRMAVVDANGAVHGVEGLYVADASIMPSITRGNTNLPTALIGARIAAHLAGIATDRLPALIGMMETMA